MPESNKHKPARIGPFKIGLTGSIAMGKSETAKLFVKAGIPAYDADAVVHALYGLDGDAVEPIERAFPGTTRQGFVDRNALAARLGKDQAAFARLEAIVHPLVRAAEAEFLGSAAKRGDEFVVLNIPLLFETGRENDMDAIVVVSAPPAIQRARVLSRPGMSEEKFLSLHARQVPDADKRGRADFIIETDKGLAQAYESVLKIIAELHARAAKA